MTLRRFLALTTSLMTPNVRAMATPATHDKQVTIHLNHAGASPSSDTVRRRVQDHLEQESLCGGYAAKDQVHQELCSIYERAARLVNSHDPLEIALVESATSAWTKLFYTMAAYQQQHRPKSHQKVILVSQAEYAANLVAACQWARTHEGWSVLMIPSTKEKSKEAALGSPDSTTTITTTGTVDLESLDAMLNGTYKVGEGILNPESIAMVCITHIPTNSGIVNPMNEIGRRMEEFNRAKKARTDIFFLADTCQSIGQLPIDVQQMRCSGLVATGRKYLRGPRGTGFLYIPNDVSELLIPSHIDHFGLPVVDIPSRGSLHLPLENILKYAPRQGARRFEFWESNVAGRLGLGQALKEHLDLGQTKITAILLQRARYLTDLLLQLQGVNLHYQSNCGLVTFFVDGAESSAIFERLARYDEGIAFELSVVPSSSTPLDTAATRVPDLVRASVSYTTTNRELDLFVQRLKQVIHR